ncbi:PTS sugar transporter subunit IIA [Salidesulfovibrio onnuriiensis]|uniref:PTS sugar transporter subunit IIA n=1 Tax=Salidesulfovibrio onnuriiensis TaxID=2583823 RepID=UPI0011CB9C48|nr:PTS sugar transporter subunit IIA [Salidesulfovibrio onnuriiensis]
MPSNEQHVGIVVVTHGDFGRELIKAAEMVLGAQERCFAVSVDVKREVDETVEAIRQAAHKAGAGTGVLILTDLFGGSPTTLSLSLLKADDLEVVTGVNLPMVIKALQARSEALGDLAAAVRDAGLQGIVVAGELLRKKTRKK